jgi:hypothetical protein
MTAAAAPTYTLRCHSCSRRLDVVAVPMRIVGMFRASKIGAVAMTYPGEVRHKCQSCKWVNVFHPVTTPSWRRIEVK